MDQFDALVVDERQVHVVVPMCIVVDLSIPWLVDNLLEASLTHTVLLASVFDPLHDWHVFQIVLVQEELHHLCACLLGAFKEVFIS